MENSERLVVCACNFKIATNIFSAGSKAYVMLIPGGNPDAMLITGRSRSGRIIGKYERSKKLTNFRIISTHDNDPLWKSAVGKNWKSFATKYAETIYQNALRATSEGRNGKQ